MQNGSAHSGAEQLAGGPYNEAHTVRNYEYHADRATPLHAHPK